MAVTRFELEQYHEVYRRLDLNPDQVVYLPHPYDEAVFHPRDEFTASSSARRIDGEALLVYPVNVYPRKNIELAIAMLAVLKRSRPVRMIVTGRIWDKAYHTALRDCAHRHGVENNVEFLGGVSLERLVDLYHEADATIFTSHQETYGHGIVESLGCGTPVIGPDWIIPCAEILGDNIGGRVAPKDPESFAATVLSVLDSPMDPNTVASDACRQYGNRAIAQRFLDAVRPYREAKMQRSKALSATNWKGLYCDAGDLL